MKTKEVKSIETLKDVQGIISSNMTIAEKLNILNAIRCNSKNICKAQYDFVSRIEEKKKRLYDNLHSRDCKLGHNINSVFYQLHIHNYAIDSWIARVNRRLSDLGCALRVNDILDIYGEVKKNKKNISILGKKIIELTKIKEEEEERRKENEDFLQNYGVPRWSVTNYMYMRCGASCIIGSWAFHADEDIKKDWHAYSRTWHNTHGPKISIENRHVDVYFKGKKINTITLDSWRGNWFDDVIVEAMGLKPVKVKRGLKKIQMSKYFEISERVRILKNTKFKVYEIQVKGNTIMYCAYDEVTDIEYHGVTVSDAVMGLQNKIAAYLQNKAIESKVVTAEYLNKNKGFCYIGMTEFAAACGIDRDAEYTIAQLKEVAKKCDKSILRKYDRELSMIGII